MKLFNKIVLGLALTASGCMSLLAQAPACGPAVNGKTLTVGMDVDAGLNPWGFTSNGKTVGFDVDLACQIQRILAFGNLVIKKDNYSNLLNDLNAGTVDLVISDFSVTPVVAGAASYVLYAQDNLGIIYRTGTLPGITSANALATLAGLAVAPGNATGVIGNFLPPSATTIARREGAILVTAGLPAGNAASFTNLTAALAALNAGQIIAIFTDLAVANRAAATATPAGSLTALQVTVPTTAAFAPFQSAGLGIAIRSSCTALIANVQTVVNQLLGVNGATAATGETLADLAKADNVVPFAAPTPAAATPANTVPVRGPLATFILQEFCSDCTPTTAS